MPHRHIISITVALIAISIFLCTINLKAYAVNRVTLSGAGTSDSEENWWKADIGDYDNSCTKMIEYKTVDGTECDDQVIEGEVATGSEQNQLANNTLIAFSSDTSYTTSTDLPTSAVSSTDKNTFAFSTYGWGHCVGMPQNGANLYATYAGWNYQQILFHYYQGTSLVQTAVPSEITVGNMTGSVQDVVAAVVNLEEGSSFSYEALKAQAVAVYTYIMHYGGVAKDLKGKSNPASNIVSAVSETLGQALFYNNDYILAMFTASSGGATANCADIFSMDIPYLRSVPSDYDAYDQNYGTVVYKTVDEVRNIIESRYGITLSDNPYNWIKITTSVGGYADKVTIDDQKTVNGNDFINVLGLKSPKFTYILNY